jgi:hypothetical protein
MLDDARHQMARYYLGKSVLESNEAAYLLGYEDAQSFVRAFRSWERHPARTLARDPQSHSGFLEISGEENNAKTQIGKEQPRGISFGTGCMGMSFGYGRRTMKGR